MSGFTKRSRLAPSGSGKGPNQPKGPETPDSPGVAKPSSAPKAANKKLQWSMGDVLNKLDNPETQIADAKAAIETPTPPPAQTVSTQSKRVEPARVEPSKPPAAKPADKPAEKPAPQKAVENLNTIVETAQHKTAAEPDWAAPAASPSGETWEAPATSAADAEWARASSIEPETWNKAEAPAGDPELWGKAEGQQELWGASTESSSNWAVAATEDAGQEIWAKSEEQQPDQWAKAETAERDVWAASSNDAEPDWAAGATAEPSWAADSNPAGDNWAQSGAEPEGEVWAQTRPADVQQQETWATSAEPAQAWQDNSSEYSETSFGTESIDEGSTDFVDDVKSSRSAEIAPDWQEPTISTYGAKIISRDEFAQPQAAAFESSEPPSWQSSAEETEATAASIDTPDWQQSEPAAPAWEDSERTNMDTSWSGGPSYDAETEGHATYESAANNIDAVAAGTDETYRSDAGVGSDTAYGAYDSSETEAEPSTTYSAEEPVAPYAATEPEYNAEPAFAAYAEPEVVAGAGPEVAAQAEPEVAVEAEPEQAQPAEPARKAPFGAAAMLMKKAAEKKSELFTNRIEKEESSDSEAAVAAEAQGESVTASVDEAAQTQNKPNYKESEETGIFQLPGNWKDQKKPQPKQPQNFAARLEGAVLNKLVRKPESTEEDFTPSKQSQSSPRTPAVTPQSTSGTRTPVAPAAQAAPAEVPAEQAISASNTPAVSQTMQSQSGTGTPVVPGAVPPPPPSQFSRDKLGFETTKINQRDLEQIDKGKVSKANQKAVAPQIKSSPSVPVQPAASASTPAAEPKKVDKSEVPPISIADLDAIRSPGKSASAPITPPPPAETAGRGMRATTSNIRSFSATKSNKHQRVLIAATVALLVAAGGWFTWSFKEKQDVLGKVQSEFNNKRYAEASASLEKALTLYPNEAILHYYKGRLLSMQNDQAKALVELNTANDASPNTPDILKERANVLAAMGKIPEAVADYDAAIAKEGSKADLYIGRGSTHLKANNPDKALADFQQAIKLEPSNPAHYGQRATAYEALHKYDEAIKDWSTVIAKQPRNAIAFAHRGLAAYRGKQSAKGIADIDKSLKLEPSSTAFFYRGLIKQDQKQVAAAIADYTQALRFDPTNAAIIEAKANAYVATGDFEKALNNFNALATMQGGGGQELLPRRAAAAMAAGKFHDAANAYAKLLEEKPDDTALLLKHAEACEAAGQFAKAYEDYSKLIDKEPNNVHYYVKRGWVSTKQKSYTVADSDFEKAISLNSSSAEAYLTRGLASEMRGQYVEAVVDLQHSLKIEPNNEVAKKKLRELARYISKPQAIASSSSRQVNVKLTGDPETDGYNLMSAGQLSEAIEQFRKAITAHPNKASSRRYIAYCLLESGQASEAVNQFRALMTIDPNLQPADFHKYMDALSRSGNQDEAIELLNKKLASNPADAGSRLMLAKIYTDMSMDEKAIRILQQGANYSRGADHARLQEMLNTINDKINGGGNSNKDSDPAPANTGA